jgi:hypothetical protein
MPRAFTTFGDGDFIPAGVPSIAWRMWNDAHAGHAPLRPCMVRRLFQRGVIAPPTEPGSLGWCRLIGPGALWDGELVTHVDSSNAALDRYVQTARAAKVARVDAARAARWPRPGQFANAVAR